MSKLASRTRPNENDRHFRMAAALRVLAIDAVEKAASGHPGMPMGMADVATVLFDRHYRSDPSVPDWPNRDRFVLSAGHGSMLLYGLLHLTGHPDMPMSELRAFRQLDSRTAGHPEYGLARGIETTTGPLGQGLATAVGMAMAERMLASRFGDRVFDHCTYVIAGDGCLMEGISQEAITLAGHLRLTKLIVLFDDNGISIDGPVSLTDSTDQISRFQSAGWDAVAIDGHDPKAIDRAIAKARRSQKPNLICCRTTIGAGAPNKQGTAAAHGAPLGAEEANAAREFWKWKLPPFQIPAETLKDWRTTGQKGREARLDWQRRIRALPKPKRSLLETCLREETPAELGHQLANHKRKISDERPKMATRKASELALDIVNRILPYTVGGSADLTGSNNTLTRQLKAITPEDFSGRYVHWGVREHTMAAAMSGLALHGGVIPYGGTFLVFSDYARPAIRLSALMGKRVIFVMTHDSIGLGEDGPTHQPIEHLAMLRATPNLNVFRPADAVETAECWQLALQSHSTPSVIALSRQALPTVRTEHKRANLSARGAYILAQSSARCRVILLATGSEVSIAVAAREALEQTGIPTRVVSMPCEELFIQQADRYRRTILPRGPVRIAIEAGGIRGWERWLFGEGGSEKKSSFVGMESFGASAPGADLYLHFDIRSETVVREAQRLLG